MYRCRHRGSIRLAAAAVPAFEYLDDPVRLSAHMARRARRLAGSQMQVTPDAAGGREIGSQVTLSGTVLSYALGAELRICERDPPRCKVWETRGTPRLLVIGHYRMGFSLQPESVDITTLSVFIEFDPPAYRAGPAMMPIGAFYARWCVQNMLIDAARRSSCATRAPRWWDSWRRILPICDRTNASTQARR